MNNTISKKGAVDSNELAASLHPISTYQRPDLILSAFAGLSTTGDMVRFFDAYSRHLRTSGEGREAVFEMTIDTLFRSLNHTWISDIWHNNFELRDKWAALMHDDNLASTVPRTGKRTVGIDMIDRLTDLHPKKYIIDAAFADIRTKGDMVRFFDAFVESFRKDGERDAMERVVKGLLNEALSMPKNPYMTTWKVWLDILNDIDHSEHAKALSQALRL